MPNTGSAFIYVYCKICILDIMTTQIRYQYDFWTYVSGPIHQLHTWRPYMEMLAESGLSRSRHFFIHCVNQHPDQFIYECFPWEFLEETCAENSDKQIIVILDSHTEGPSLTHIHTTVDRMISEFGIDLQCIIQWTGSRGEENETFQRVTVIDAFSVITFADIAKPQAITHHFSMLARIPKRHRILAAVEILQRKLDIFGYISCGSGDHGPINTTVFDVDVPLHLRSRFPLLLPGEHFNHIQTHEFTVDSITSPMVTGSFCSVIPETTHDLMFPSVWTAFLTEKSEKCFLLEQVPIWIAPPRQVELARDFGFDVFDDLIDHSYDHEPNPYCRIKLAIDQLEKICKLDLNQLRDFKLSNQSRFTANRDLCFHLRAHHHDMQYDKLVSCISQMPVFGVHS